MWLYFVVFFIICGFCLINKREQYSVAAFIILILICIAGLRAPIDRDYNTYVSMYKQICEGLYVNIEPSFYLLTYFINYYFADVNFLFLTFAIIGVISKAVAFSKLSEFLMYSILIYFSYYFILQEMTQIRVGVASAMILLSITSIKEKNLKSFLFYIGIGVFFHYSTLIMLPTFFIRNNTMPKIYFFLIPISFFIHYSEINLLSVLQYITYDSIALKYETYRYLANRETVNPFNAWNLFRCVFCMFLLYNWKYLQTKNNYAVLLIKFYALSIFFFLAFSKFPTFAFRISDLFATVEIILIPFILYFIKDKYTILGTTTIFLIALVMLCISLFYIELLENYFL